MLAGLRAILDKPQLQISVEKFDDVAFETTIGEPTELIQTKHHITRAGDLSGASSDLWKTLLIWSKRVRLEGWWLNVVMKALSGTGPAAIPVLAIDQRVDELREEFKRRALPIDFKGSKPSPEVVADLDRRPFVRQLRKIRIGTERVEFAIRDYYRASAQRSRWAREDLLVDGELEAYEQDLVEAWEPRFAAMIDELSPGCAGGDAPDVAKLLYSAPSPRRRPPRQPVAALGTSGFSRFRKWDCGSGSGRSRRQANPGPRIR